MKSQTIPRLAFGTGTAHYLGPKEQDSRPLSEPLIQYIVNGVQAGFRHLDGAEVYGNEREVGEALRRCGIDREELFITTKCYQGRDNPKAALEKSLQRLGTTYVDLYLIHVPFDIPIKATWQKMEELVDQGLARQIGVSNFRIRDFEEFLSEARIKPVCNQIEWNPYLQLVELQDYMKQHHIALAAYSPLMPLTHAKGGPLDPVVEAIAARHGKTPTQILLAWCLAHGHIAVTTTSQMQRCKEILESESIQLTKEEIQEIAQVGATKTFRKYWVDKF
ncbi:hypothetical protein HDU91_000634 [Kappamyces sp. JEL0680]|nr:hypothetical protein HDU91_000634 [Kappamyces sp. JEL0680]